MGNCKDNVFYEDMDCGANGNADVFTTS